jgi:hypothetical protein
MASSNNVSGWLCEKSTRKYYRLRGVEFARFPDTDSQQHEKRAKIDKYTECLYHGFNKDEDLYEFELVVRAH